MSGQNVMKSAMLLSISGAIAKTVDFVFRAYYSKCLGSEGMGIFSLVFSVHAIMLNIATGGIGVAVSKLVSGYMGQRDVLGIRKTMKAAMLSVTALSLIVIVCVYIYSDKIAYYFLKEPRCRRSIVFISPSILFMGISYCIKGYFYASRRVVLPASSEFLEQFVKITVISYLLKLWLPKGVQYGCEAVFLGLSIGELASCAYLLMCYGLSIGKTALYSDNGTKKSGFILGIVGIAVPVMLSSLLGSLLRSQEDVWIVSGLRRFGMSNQGALESFGAIHGMVMPLMVFPLTLMSSVLTLLVPEISRADGLRDKQRLRTLVERVYRFTTFGGFLVLAVYFVFAGELAKAVYSEPEIAGYIRAFALICPIMFFDSVSASILNGLGKQGSLFAFNMLDCGLRLLLIGTLLPVIGIRALVIIIFLSNILTASMTVSRAAKFVGIGFHTVGYILKPLIAAAISCGIFSGVLSAAELESYRSIAMAIAVFTAVYTVVSLLSGALGKRDILWIMSRFAKE